LGGGGFHCAGQRQDGLAGLSGQEVCAVVWAVSWAWLAWAYILLIDMVICWMLVVAEVVVALCSGPCLR
jgi:hypothetical protein